MATATSCGVGACLGNTGVLNCVAGGTVDTCDPLAGATADTNCNGIDEDCDGTADDGYVATATSCGVGACLGNTGVLNCVAGGTVDTCDPLAGATADTNCNGIDEDCDGTADDGYVATATSCGVGACLGNTGVLNCVAGGTVDTCDPLAGATADTNCNGIDEDCDGTADDGYVATATSCGVGACLGNTGVLNCVAGGTVDTCDPLAGATADTNCNGIDEDCDGTADDGYVATATSCGVGACLGNTGVLNCVAGGTVDTCDPLAGATADTNCNGIDEDCDGTADDGYVATATSCGVGACLGNTGVLNCVAGGTVDTCDPLAGATADTNCNGIDEDCDGTADDGYVATATSCGVGACLGNTGVLNCVAGGTVDTCDPLAGATADTNCNGIDEDCDGTADDGYVATATSCGVGACLGNTGVLNCVAGGTVDTCDPLAGATADTNCNGIDEDCDGTADDGYVATATSCGVGACLGNTGVLNCVAGGTVDTCDPLAGATADTNCNGIDEDCDGTADDGYVATATSCGVGACLGNTGVLNCVAGGTVDTCDPLAGATADTNCNGIDEDCDGTADDGYVATATSCGVGACLGNTGVLNCVAGGTVDTCDPLAGATADTNCNGIDEDCDGTADDGYVATATSCGVGACLGNTGVLNCVAGGTVDTCDPLAGATADTNCNGIDEDCDGTADDGYVATATSCGVGACLGNTGVLNCVAGGTVDTCDPLAGATADTNCNGIDEDCDGTADDGYVATATSCGVGACLGNTGVLNCVAGGTVDTCDPLAGATADTNCNGIDEDCDGTADDGYVATATSCGVGACLGNTGVLNCVAGGTVDTCDPLAGATADTNCNGIDEDCDGTADDGYVATATSCGVGACLGNTGVLNCVAGGTVDTCDPLAGATADTNCNGIDEDCDGSSR